MGRIHAYICFILIGAGAELLKDTCTQAHTMYCAYQIFFLFIKQIKIKGSYIKSIEVLLRYKLLCRICDIKKPWRKTQGHSFEFVSVAPGAEQDEALDPTQAFVWKVVSDTERRMPRNSMLSSSLWGTRLMPLGKLAKWCWKCVQSSSSPGREAVVFVHNFLSHWGYTQVAIIQCPTLSGPEKLLGQWNPGSGSWKSEQCVLKSMHVVYGRVMDCIC